MNQNQVAITNIEITVNEKTIKLGLEEAKELKKILGELFPEIQIIPLNPNPPIVINPIWVAPTPNPFERRWWDYIVTCDGTSSSLCVTSKNNNTTNVNTAKVT